MAKGLGRNVRVTTGRRFEQSCLRTAMGALLFLFGCALPSAGADPPAWEIRVLSSRPDMVSGGDALVQVTGPAGAALEKAAISLNGHDVTQAFHPGRAARSLAGLVEGLALGNNSLDVAVAGRIQAQLKLVNHPRSGPIFSGPHQEPFICQTETSGLGAPLDADCSAGTEVLYIYKSTQPVAPRSPETPPGQRGVPQGFKLYDPAAPRPADMARTTTTEGRTVDYIVRKEIGTINRAIYMIALLHDPALPLPNAWTAEPELAWNGRLVYSFGGGCRAGYHQSMAPPGAMNDTLLSKGYASASASLNVFGNNCDDVISAETMMMVKEHFIETFGVPAYTIGWGGSGGSMQQHLIAQNYPGLLDGILPNSSYPDITTMITPVVDCSLLAHAFENAGQPWTDEQKTAVAGFATWGTAERWIRSFSPGWIRPSNCHQAVPKDLVYDPSSNRGGARCTIYDNQVNVYGRDPGTGFARSPLDNVGVQYGLVAFNAGKISFDQFLELNGNIGGYDADGNIVPARTVADREALRRAYRTGRVNSGAGLNAIPIIDLRPYRDPIPDIHDRVRSFAMRERLKSSAVHPDNHVILTFPGSLAQESGPNRQMQESLQWMDRWLENIAQDASPGNADLKVARNRPAGLADACWSPEGEKIVEPQTFDGPGRCNRLFPNHGDPRMAAGAPLAGDILKCSLKPVDPKDYSRPLTAGQLDRLKAIFPQGVCDYSRPGVEQQKPSGPWQMF